MKAGEIIEQLLIIFYRTYEGCGTVRQYGIYPHSLTDNSGIRFSDAGDALAAVRRMKDSGWVRILNDPRAKRLESWHKVQLTEEGISYAEELSKPAIFRYLRNICIATKEGITKRFKKQ